MKPVMGINQDIRFGRFNSGMANLEAQFTPTQRTRTSQKWSGRRTIGIALVASGALWTLIFWAAKALLA